MDVCVIRTRWSYAKMDEKLTDANRLSIRYPDLVAEWHPTENEPLTPHDVSYGSGKKVWWICKKGDDHEWKATIHHRTSGRGCPFCSGKRVSDTNRLSIHFRYVAAEWHPTKNEPLTPHDVVYGSHKKVWWLCEHGHEWKVEVFRRTIEKRTIKGRELEGVGCPQCASGLSVYYPDVAAEWHPTKNEPLTPHDVSYGSNKKVWWLCEHGHEWDAVVSSRTSIGTGCPFCSGRRATDANRLSIRYPDVAAEWHPTKNEPLTPHDVAYGSHKKVWWLCEHGHEWKVEVFRRTIEKRTIKGREIEGIGCPQCAGGLSVYYPDVAAQWHPTKNEPLTPDDVSYASSKKVWWICKKVADHEWKDTVNHRTSGRGCPFCSGKRVSDTNRLSIHCPDVAVEWHPTKNEPLTPHDVNYKSNEKAWWLCKRGHEWEATIWSRARLEAGCRQCKLVHTSKVEIYLRCELSSVFPDIDPRNTIKIDKWRVDVMIPSEKLVLEYDGGWRHDSQKSYARDMRKTEELKIKGWTVIRIREMPLGRIQSHDLLVDVTFPGDDKIKILTGNVLRHIEKVLGKDIPGVDEYIARRGLAKRELARDIANEIIDESPHPPDQDRLF